MKKQLLAMILAGAAVATASPALARQGCGAGFHRGPYGHCIPNRGPGRRPVVLVIGRYYPGHGWWDGRRYWHDRYRRHGHWRYR